MRCLNESSGLNGLFLYDRPAIIFLTIDNVSSYAVVLKAGADSVVLDVLDQEHVISADSLRQVWDGSFRLLWKPPPNVSSLLQQGATGPSALWLRRAIDRIEGVQSSGTVFDAPLAVRVRQFQRANGLAPDGIVGPRTFILLQNKLAEARG
jgi:general secretion pathway protein A